MKLRSALLASLVAAALSVSPAAKAIDFVFSPGPGEATLGTSHVFWDTTNTYFITAYGFVTSGNTPTNLYQKFDGVGETGLGIAADSPDTEIPPQYYVQLDVSNLIANGFSAITFKLGSLQTNEQANIFGDTTWGTFADGSSVAALVGGPTIQWTTLSLSTQFFNITGGGATGADPVLESASVKTPDAGASIALLGMALLGVVGFSKIRSRRA